MNSRLRRVEWEHRDGGTCECQIGRGVGPGGETVFGVHVLRSKAFAPSADGDLVGAIVAYQRLVPEVTNEVVSSARWFVRFDENTSPDSWGAPVDYLERPVSLGSNGLESDWRDSQRLDRDEGDKLWQSLGAP